MRYSHYRLTTFIELREGINKDMDATVGCVCLTENDLDDSGFIRIHQEGNVGTQ